MSRGNPTPPPPPAPPPTPPPAPGPGRLSDRALVRIFAALPVALGAVLAAAVFLTSGGAA